MLTLKQKNKELMFWHGLFRKLQIKKIEEFEKAEIELKNKS